MCGIVGAAGEALPAGVHAAVRGASDLLTHRGPDAGGATVVDTVSIGHRRLSVLDTGDRANQPMWSPSKDAVIVFNGEIYNFPELRDDLASRGERFTTTGDTEVLLRLLERDGPAALERVAGMFALAMWRRSTGELLLARDRFGEKPLFIARRGGDLYFASELQALLELPGLPRRVDRRALACYFETGYVPAPGTLFEGIESLEPGEWLVWKRGTIRRGAVRVPQYAPDPELARPEAAREAVLAALRTAVRRQMISDVPLGAFLSGGIDSSSVAALMQEASSAPIKTFNVRFEEARYDESAVARRVAAHLGTDHHELTVTDASFQPEDLLRVVRHVGMPFADSSAIPTFVVSRHARRHVTVALSGDGGDEMFAGYPAFQWADRLERLARLPRALLRTGARAAGLGAGSRALPGAGRLRQARKALEYAALPGETARFRALHWLFAPEERQALTTDSAPPGCDAYLRMPADAQRWTPLRRRMYSRLRYELAGDMLVKVDRMSMAVSLEVRAPFLDAEVAAVSARLPDHHLIQHGCGKHVLREAVRSLLPDEVFSHPKWGFSIPLHRFVNDRFREAAAELLRAGGPLEGLVRQPAASAILARGLRRHADAGDYSVYQATHQLWALMQLAAWRRMFAVTV
ncbi:MAG TPA: asparagine synthase (glutamine-hydrolyzing) [Vicinamibacterales bacterium]|nr:asparagine synthase (glutamine-hydrolyzing) [Vicinamibacterales bacterium]